MAPPDGTGASYRAMLAALFAARGAGMRLGLDRVARALARLDHPERRVGPVLHVAGTNGKGSTAAILEAALRAGGWRTGLYTSPHLCRFTERFRVEGREVEPERLAGLHAGLRDALDGAADLTFFELTTLLGLVVLAEARVEVTVLEVGLGGRLDATNAVDAEVGIVTGVSLDHENILGFDLAGIAREKAGIFKPGRAAVVGLTGEAAARPVLVAEARRRAVGELVVLGQDAPAAPPEGWRLGLRGAHQRGNAACALAALDALERETGGRVTVGAAARRAGLADVRWPGRLELLAGAADRPPVLLDAAHNPEGARSLAAELDAPDLRTRGAPVVVVGVSSDKDVDGVLGPIVGRAGAVYATSARSSRALPAADLAARVRALGAPGGARVVEEPDPERALEAALAAAGPGGLVVLYGSIFLVGPLRARLCGEGCDPVEVQDPVGAAAGRAAPSP